MVKPISMLLIDQRLAEDLDDGLEAFESRQGVRIVTNMMVLREVVYQTLALIKEEPREAMWGGYLVIDPQTNSIVGTCGFKHGPAEGGVVEIAYFTFPEFEGQGYATAMAMKLKELAERSPLVRQIIAHTLPERNPSTRILERIGMRLEGEIEDPEDGKVWRWISDAGTEWKEGDGEGVI